MREKLSLDGKWSYRLVTQEGKELSGQINVPYPVESPLSGVGYKGFVRSLNYSRSVKLPPIHGRIIISFMAVDYKCVLSVNGHEVGQHRGGYSPFSFDITRFVVEGVNEVSLDVIDDVSQVNQPRGKQCVDPDPHGCFYTRVTGIWQSVWIEERADVHIQDLRVDSSNADGNVDFFISLSGRAECEAVLLIDGVEVERSAVDDTHLHIHHRVEDPRLWSPDDPQLYSYEVRLGEDSVSGHFGFRSLTWSTDGIHINGKRTVLALVMDQGYYGDGIYTPTGEEEFERDIRLAKSLGFNGARLHEKVFPEAYLALADRLGFLVFNEYPSWGLDSTSMDTFDIMAKEWSECVTRASSHPSVICHVPFNETVMGQNDELIRKVYELTRQLDPSRPVIDTSGFYHVVTDIYDIHDYEQDAQVLVDNYQGPLGSLGHDQYRGRYGYDGRAPLFMSEFGGTYYDPENFPSGLFPKQDEAWLKWPPVKSEEDYVQRLVSLIDALSLCPFIGFCLTQLYDVEAEINGLFTSDRKPKFSLASYARIAGAIGSYRRREGK